MRAKGQAYEQQARRFLERQQLRFIAANCQCRFGELDLVMQDQQHLVFVEVKYRQQQHFGGALAAITASKQRKLRQCAHWYLQQHGSLEQPCRFDVIAIEGDNINWIQNAF
ncbi:YraN family protein [Ferrimonas senticii]|uniref:YraN family protein n=1 Tax=Ferrimonas senticii TaxID=394566 RepID=UPI0004101767|nr:YraN family protein [Ferrimonas senticii]